MRYRFENFGGIIASEEPPFLAFVDRQFMREQGLGESPLWEGGGEGIGLLSAPTEVHLAATSGCPMSCPHCYMEAGERAAGEMDLKTFKRALAVLADFGVFHVALGGGEGLVREDIFEIARHTRELGMVPNLTISGNLMTPQMAARMTVFGQVNVSLDGVGPCAGVFRDPRLFERADQALELLVDAGVPTGINCVLGRRNFDGVPELFSYALSKGVNEIEFLRLKPVGRARSSYESEKTTPQQNASLTPMLAGLSEQTGLTAKIDCSFVPMMCHHDPPQDLLEATATYGCEAANVLLGVSSEGRVNGCSFLRDEGLPLLELPERWAGDGRFQRLRSWTASAPEPCSGCAYLQLCKGGCHAVAEFVCGDLLAPDPDCPRVVRHRQREAR